MASGTMARQSIFSGQFDASTLQASSAPNAVAMPVLHQRKLDKMAKDRAAGVFDVGRYEKIGATACTDGKAGEYKCGNVDLKDFLRHQDTGSETREGNDIWGWTSPTGREIALLGQSDGTSFVEVLKDGSLRYLARLPTHTEPSTWRDIKVIGDFAYIGSEAEDHGLQIFNLNKVLEADPEDPPTYSSSDLTAHFDGFGSSHNIVANEETNLIAAVGTDRSLECRAGLWMIDVSDPENPEDVGCVSDDGYVHDAQCVIYQGPHKEFQGQEICFNYNEDSLTIVNIDDREKPSQISRTTYNGATYTHQGWLTSDHKYLLLDDELDEQEQTGPAADQHTTTYVVDVSSLTSPVFCGVYKSPQVSIDHNQYIIDGISYQANYGSGLRMVNVSSIGSDPSGAGFEEIGFFDVRPEDDDVGGKATFHGAWSVYPYFESEYIVVSSIERGMYSLKYTG
ncbi:hypothetical protein GMORB2_1468 [Geosmithia morbida]|uniref:Regulatory P domain-containing protein n=1 Tax=Geosmithia morbida TaxID=1094350 RepID=A0A9P4Z160_9HYPO|nr:uncharacterized protein GMORB2_1468 [Geosmithia morbida]KAF4126222.1 hypothetical protein GMORB2_1468 [Geosmithia morbida]